MLNIYTDGDEWIIAESEENAVRIWEDMFEEDAEEYGLSLRVMEDTETITVIDDDPSGDYPKGATVLPSGMYSVEVTATAKEWVNYYGKETHLCSTNF